MGETPTTDDAPRDEGDEGATNDAGAQGGAAVEEARGTVALVGAGAGDPGLIAVRGLRLLRAAAVVVHDGEAVAALLAEAPPAAELVDVSGAASGTRLRAKEIGRLLAARARAGARVVRLVAGDPFTSAVADAEAEALAKAGIPWELVPGVAPTLAWPAYAGIPLTHGAWRRFAVEGESDRPDKSTIAAFGTLVAPVDAARLQPLTAELVGRGWPAQTPAAAIWWGATPRQRTVTGTLGDISARARAEGLAGPAVLVAGAVVRLRERLRWFDNRPLTGRRIAITRAEEQAPELAERLEAQGAQVMTLAAIRIEPAEDGAPLDAALAALDSYDWVLFTSANGVRALARRLWATGRDWRALRRARVGAIGPATARELEAWHLRADLVPREYVAEGLLDALGNVAGQRLLLPRADIARQALAAELRLRGAEVDEVTAYRTVARPPDAAALRRALVEVPVDAITFTSSSTVRGFVAGVEAAGLGAPGALLRGIAVACIGPITARTAREHGLEPAVTAREYTIDGLTRALVRHFSPTTPPPKGAARP